MQTSTTESRRQYIRNHYALEQTSHGWRATWTHSNGNSVIEGADYDAVRRSARAQWAHFNFDDEAEEFAHIFPRTMPALAVR